MERLSTTEAWLDRNPMPATGASQKSSKNCTPITVLANVEERPNVGLGQREVLLRIA